MLTKLSFKGISDRQTEGRNMRTRYELSYLSSTYIYMYIYMYGNIYIVQFLYDNLSHLVPLAICLMNICLL